MHRIVKWGTGIEAVALVAASILYVNREANVLKKVGFAVKQRLPVGGR